MNRTHKKRRIKIIILYFLFKIYLRNCNYKIRYIRITLKLYTIFNILFEKIISTRYFSSLLKDDLFIETNQFSLILLKNIRELFLKSFFKFQI